MSKTQNIPNQPKVSKLSQSRCKVGAINEVHSAFPCEGECDVDKQSNRQIMEVNSSSMILKHVKSVESVFVRNTNSRAM